MKFTRGLILFFDSVMRLRDELISKAADDFLQQNSRAKVKVMID